MGSRRQGEQEREQEQEQEREDQPPHPALSPKGRRRTASRGCGGSGNLVVHATATVHSAAAMKAATRRGMESTVNSGMRHRVDSATDRSRMESRAENRIMMKAAVMMIKGITKAKAEADRRIVIW